MSFLSKESELINFINSKIVKKNEIVYNTILYYFIKVMKEAILKSFKRLHEICWIQECLLIVFNIFWNIFTYTHNIKLTMFLCERGIMLFNEYIDLAKNTFSENNENFKINSTDVKLFIYKRTIGPIKLKVQTKQFMNIISKLKIGSISLKNLIDQIILLIIDSSKNNNTELLLKLTSSLNYVENMLPDMYYKLYNQKIYINLDYYLPLLSKYDIVFMINKIKLDCELLYYIYKSNRKNKENCLSIFYSLEYNNELEDIPNKMFTTKNYKINKEIYYIKKKNKFKQLVSKK